MSYYRLHVFVCENRRDGGEACCAARPAAGNAVKFLRDILKGHSLHGKGRVRVNRAGCFNRCDEGPVLAVYPCAVWYRYESDADLREIAESHLVGGKPVERLMLASSAPVATEAGLQQ